MYYIYTPCEHFKLEETQYFFSSLLSILYVIMDTLSVISNYYGALRYTDRQSK